MKAIFTTGEAAEICKVSQQTIIRCFDSGRLKGFRVPGSRFRRIPRTALIAFMREHNIPIDALDNGKRRVLVIGPDDSIVTSLQQGGEFEVRLASTGYEAGLVTQEFLPDLIVLAPMESSAEQLSICRTIRHNSELQHIRIVAAGKHTPAQAEQLKKSGCQVMVAADVPNSKLASHLADVLA